MIIFSSVFPANYTHFICERNDDNNVTCQGKRIEYYGLLNNSTVKFPLSGINIEKKSKEKCITSVRDETLQECYRHGDTITINTYKIYLLSSNNLSTVTLSRI